MKNADEDKVDKALHYLIDSSEEYAEACSDSRYYYQLLKEVLPDFMREAEASGYVRAEGSQELRKANARLSPDYKELLKKREEALKNYRQAEYTRVRVESGRIAAQTTISVWQSLNRQKGF